MVFSTYKAVFLTIFFCLHLQGASEIQIAEGNLRFSNAFRYLSLEIREVFSIKSPEELALDPKILFKIGKKSSKIKLWYELGNYCTTSSEIENQTMIFFDELKFFCAFVKKCAYNSQKVVPIKTDEYVQMIFAASDNCFFDMRAFKVKKSSEDSKLVFGQAIIPIKNNEIFKSLLLFAAGQKKADEKLDLSGFVGNGALVGHDKKLHTLLFGNFQLYQNQEPFSLNEGLKNQIRLNVTSKKTVFIFNFQDGTSEQHALMAPSFD